MSSELPDDLLGAGDGDPSRRRGTDGDGEAEALAKFVFVSIGDRRLAIAVDRVKTIIEPPSELTRVPRSPPAIEGVTDLRGEITAVIEPRAHFAIDAGADADRKLLVFDRANDEQSAAVRVDEVHGVEAVPESDVVDADELEAGDDGVDARTHPLLGGVVRRERRPDVDVADAIGAGTVGGGASRDDADRAEPTDSSGVGDLERVLGERSSLGGSIGTEDRFEGETFDLGDDEREGQNEEESPEDDEDDAVVETTALLDVDELLLASGRPA